MTSKFLLKLYIFLFLLLFVVPSSFAQNNNGDIYYQKAEELKHQFQAKYRRSTKSIGAYSVGVLKNWDNKDKKVIENMIKYYKKAADAGSSQSYVELARFQGSHLYNIQRSLVNKCMKKYHFDSYGLLKNAADMGNDMACLIIGIDQMKISFYATYINGNNQKYEYRVNLNGFSRCVVPFGSLQNLCPQAACNYYLSKAVANGYKPAILAQQWARQKSSVLNSNLTFDVMKIAEEEPQIAYMLACMFKDAGKEGESLYWVNKAYEEYDNVDLKLSATVPIAPKYPNNAIAKPNITALNSKNNVDNVDIDIPVTNKNAANTYALIIANENYDDVKDVDYALSDGKAFKEYCLKTLGVPEENIQMRENATLNKMIAGFDWLTDICSVTNGEANVIVYYSGHGFPNEATQDSYLLPVDGSGKNTRTGLSLNELYSTLAQVKAQSVTVFLDACFSGATRGNDMLVAARGVAIKAKSGSPQGNMAVFSAAQGNETAYPYEYAKHGMFTYFLLKKLKDCKGEVTLGELGDYIQTEVSKQSVLINGKSQTPAVSVSSSMEQEWRDRKMISDN